MVFKLLLIYKLPVIQDNITGSFQRKWRLKYFILPVALPTSGFDCIAA